MKYISTRGNISPMSAPKAILQGMVSRGGLFVPESIPTYDLDELKTKNYGELAFSILEPLLCSGDDDYSETAIKDFIARSYNTERFDSEQIAPIHILDEERAVLELWHGPTAAFKDLALQIMPHFLTGAKKLLGNDKETVILVATSGDTGKAALEGFRDVEGTRVIVFYPKDGVSRVQELQMLSTKGANTAVVGVDGNFDDCQTMVKNIFGDSAFNALLNAKGFELSSANSINWGRLVPQIVYYFYAYFQLVKNKKIYMGDWVNAVVPTGNFGNILAGYYAKEAGLPIKTLVCASNRNNILTDFINTGIYDRKREFFKTTSPSMDILISSNLERFLFEITNHNAGKIAQWYEKLEREGVFKVDETTRQRIKNRMFGGYADEKAVLQTVKDVFTANRYLIDTHTAVGVCVHNDYRKVTNDHTLSFICGTASPFKFNSAVYTALTGERSIKDEFVILEKLSELSGVPIHKGLKDLDKEPVLHTRQIAKDGGRKVITEILGM